MTVNDVDLSGCNMGWWRSNIGYVQQNAALFDGTVAENISYGKLDANRDQIDAAAAAADATDFVATMQQVVCFQQNLTEYITILLKCC